MIAIRNSRVLVALGLLAGSIVMVAAPLARQFTQRPREVKNVSDDAQRSSRSDAKALANIHGKEFVAPEPQTTTLISNVTMLTISP